MLTEYDGPSNSRCIFKHLIGETIRAAFTDKDGRAVLVLSSGDAFVCGGMKDYATVYWPMRKEDVDRLVAERRAAINESLDELRDFAGVELP